MDQTDQMNQTGSQPGALQPEPRSSHNLWYVVGALVLIALGVWYFSGTKSEMEDTVPTTATQQEVVAPPVTSGDSTVDIMMDLSATPDDTEALNQAAAASAQAVDSF